MRKIAFLTTPMLVLALVFGSATAMASNDGGYTNTDTNYGECPRTDSGGYGSKDYNGDCPKPGNGNGYDRDKGGGHTLPERAWNEVVIYDHAFTPQSMAVPVGTEITWINLDNVAHTVTSTVEDGPRSGVIQPGERYSFRFTRITTIGYFCQLHPDMKGAVRVAPPTRDVPSGPTRPSDPSYSDKDNYHQSYSSNRPSQDHYDKKTRTATSTPSSSNSSASASANASANATATGGGTNTYNTYYTTPKPAETKPTTTAVAQPAPVAKATTPAVLPATGVAGAAAIFGVAVAAGTGAYYLYLRRKVSKE